MKTEVSVVLEVFNEEKRIENFLKCFQWADEIIIFDKNSTDNTVKIAKKYKARVLTVPFSEASENTVNNYKNLKTKKWILFTTCSSMMHYDLSKKIINLTSDSNFKYDVIGLPYRIYSLGFYSKYSPWYTEYKYSLIKKSVIKVSDKLHEEIQYNSKNIYKIKVENNEEAFYHFTNLNISDFLQRTIRYTKYEAKYDLKDNKNYFNVFFKLIKSVLIVIKKRTLLLGWNGVGLACAYIVYFLLKFLHFWELKSDLKNNSQKEILKLLSKYEK